MNKTKEKYGDFNTTNAKIKHCKRTYKVITPYSNTTNIEIIEILGNQYTVTRLPRPTNTEAELMCVFVEGIRYSSFAKFLKSIY